MIKLIDILLQLGMYVSIFILSLSAYSAFT
jgi:hypothetical protein